MVYYIIPKYLFVQKKKKKKIRNILKHKYQVEKNYILL